MKSILKLLALVMAVMMVLSMVACTNDQKPTDEPETSSTTVPSDPVDNSKPEDETPNDSKPVDDGKKEYTIVVKDSDGDPVVGVMVQICKEGSTCFTPARTDDNGCAVWKLDEASDYYGTVSSLEEGMPKEYFEGNFQVTLVYNPPVAE